MPLTIDDIDGLKDLLAVTLENNRLLKELLSQKHATNEDDYLTQEEVASLFDTNRKTLLAWRAKGELKAHKRGGRVYYLKSEVFKLKQTA